MKKLMTLTIAVALLIGFSGVAQADIYTLDPEYNFVGVYSWLNDPGVLVANKSFVGMLSEGMYGRIGFDFTAYENVRPRLVQIHANFTWDVDETQSFAVSLRNDALGNLIDATSYFNRLDLSYTLTADIFSLLGEVSLEELMYNEAPAARLQLQVIADNVVGDVDFRFNASFVSGSSVFSGPDMLVYGVRISDGSWFAKIHRHMILPSESHSFVTFLAGVSI